jgi:hypothetical protein
MLRELENPECPVKFPVLDTSSHVSPASVETQRRPMARTEPLKFDTTAQVRMTLVERKALDDWRRRQREIPTRPEAIREAIRRLVAAEDRRTAR